MRAGSSRSTRPGVTVATPARPSAAFLPPGETEPGKAVEDAVRLYEQGWSVRQVAAEFDTGYGVMRRVLGRHTTLRNRGGPRLRAGNKSGRSRLVRE